MDILKLIHSIACSVCQSTEKPKPQIEVLEIVSAKAAAEIDLAKMKLLFPILLDGYQSYYYTKAEDWAKVFDYIYFKGIPKYEASRMDCDDFAIWMKGLVGANFGLNYFGIVLGNSPWGYHAWNIFRTETGFLQLEPQTGRFFDLGDGEYFPEWILL